VRLRGDRVNSWPGVVEPCDDSGRAVQTEGVVFSVGVLVVLWAGLAGHNGGPLRYWCVDTSFSVRRQVVALCVGRRGHIRKPRLMVRLVELRLGRCRPAADCARWVVAL